MSVPGRVSVRGEGVCFPGRVYVPGEGVRSRGGCLFPGRVSHPRCSLVVNYSKTSFNRHESVKAGLNFEFYSTLN